MRVRNAREVRLLVPSLSLELDPAEEATVHDIDADALPHGLERVAKKTTEPKAAAADQEETD